MRGLFTKLAGITLTGSLLLTGAGQAFGQELSDAPESRWYIGLGWGEATLDNSVSGMTGTTTLDEDDDGYKIFAGYRFTKTIGLEIFYADFGKGSIRANSGDTFVSENVLWTVLADDVEIRNEMKSSGLGLVLSWPLSYVSEQPVLKRITPFIKGGGHFWESDVNIGVGAVDQAAGDTDDFGFYFGGGLNVDLHRNFAIRMEYEHFDTEQTPYNCFIDNVDYISGSIIYQF
ncbi:outer membrane beta-barrel protein [Thiovibrio sp. JS02]